MSRPYLKAQEAIHRKGFPTPRFETGGTMLGKLTDIFDRLLGRRAGTEHKKQIKTIARGENLKRDTMVDHGPCSRLPDRRGSVSSGGRTARSKPEAVSARSIDRHDSVEDKLFALEAEIEQLERARKQQREKMRRMGLL